jgi:hypothetical protein
MFEPSGKHAGHADLAHFGLRRQRAQESMASGPGHALR